jgi:hypothetical protein
MRELTVTQQSFNSMLLGLIQSGVTFEATEQPNGTILITFTGGY